MPARIIGPNPVTREVLDELIQSGIREGETLDYKRAINVEKAQAKLELCADVASFANASGGDIVFGMDEDGDAKAKMLVPLEGRAKDSTERQLRQIFNAHIDPSVPGLRFEKVDILPDGLIVTLRIPRSWNRPHSVQGNPPTFPIRDGSTKRNMKIRELREAFNLSVSIAERMKRFRKQRIDALFMGDRAAELIGGNLIVLHVMPLSAFDEPASLDVRSAMAKDMLLWPINTSGVSHKINFDGFLTYSPGTGPVESYVQLFETAALKRSTPIS